MNRRQFIGASMGLCMGGAALSLPGCVRKIQQEPFFKISLAQWSLHRQLRSGQLTTLGFVEKAKRDFDINAVEYVNQFFFDKANDRAYLANLKQRADDNGVNSLLIMVDAEGDLGNLNTMQRKAAVENHFKWVGAANRLGCHSIRVNAAGEGAADDIASACAESLRALSEYAVDYNINVIVENHGKLSSNGKWLVGVIKQVGLDNCGTLPDFGNFYEYDRYQGVREMMPYAKGVSAKSMQFDQDGNETTIDYVQMLKIVRQANYTGYIGIEYEGENPDEDQGILATKRLLLQASKHVV